MVGSYRAGWEGGKPGQDQGADARGRRLNQLRRPDGCFSICIVPLSSSACLIFRCLQDSDSVKSSPTSPSHSGVETSNLNPQTPTRSFPLSKLQEQQQQHSTLLKATRNNHENAETVLNKLKMSPECLSSNIGDAVYTKQKTRPRIYPRDTSFVYPSLTNPSRRHIQEIHFLLTPVTPGYYPSPSSYPPLPPPPLDPPRDDPFSPPENTPLTPWPPWT